jgi:chitinase
MPIWKSARLREHPAEGSVWELQRPLDCVGCRFLWTRFHGGEALNPGINQPYARFEAEHSYAELRQKLIRGAGFVRGWDDSAKAPYLWNRASRTFITYDGPQSLAIKADYVRQHHLGGMMFWEVSQDYDDEPLDVIVRALARSAYSSICGNA